MPCSSCHWHRRHPRASPRGASHEWRRTSRRIYRHRGCDARGELVRLVAPEEGSPQGRVPCRCENMLAVTVSYRKPPVMPVPTREESGHELSSSSCRRIRRYWRRSEEHTSEPQTLMRISNPAFSLK